VELLPQQWIQRYAMVRVYRDDLENIIAIIQENFDEVIIEAGGYKLSDRSDLSFLKDKLHAETLSIFQVAGFVRMDESSPLTTLRVELVQGGLAGIILTDAANTKLYGAAMKIAAILSRRRNKLLDALTSTWAQLVLFALFFSAVLFANAQPWKLGAHSTPDAAWWVAVMFACAVLAGLTPIVSSAIRKKINVLVYLSESHSRIRLTHDQRSRALLVAVTYVLGILSTVIAGLIIYYMTH
jgi:hypothetical protein